MPQSPPLATRFARTCATARWPHSRSGDLERKSPCQRFTKHLCEENACQRRLVCATTCTLRELHMCETAHEGTKPVSARMFMLRSNIFTTSLDNTPTCFSADPKTRKARHVDPLRIPKCPCYRQIIGVTVQWNFFAAIWLTINSWRQHRQYQGITVQSLLDVCHFP